MTLCGFSSLFRQDFSRHPKACLTVGILGGAVLLEAYQIAQLPFSDWAIVQMIKHQHLHL
jgi:hypothetical protein